MVRIIRTDELTSNAALSPNDTDWVYNGLDVCVTLEVRDQLLPQLDEVTARTYKFSKALQAPILDMTMRGTLISQKRRTETLSVYQLQSKRLQANLRRLVSEGLGFDPPADVFNKRTQKWQLWWRSNDQLKTLFYGVLGCAPIRKRNAKGQMVPTINRDALERLSETYFYAEPLASHILALRDIDKKRMFLETEVDPDQRIRTNFNIAGTDTGRLSSSISDFGTGGNVQNIDKELRSCFVADKGMMFANLDLEQADARNVGALCWNLFVDELGEAVAGAYLDACESGDLHTAVCRMAWSNLQWGDDPKAYRSIADQIGYRTYSYRDLAKKLGHGTNFYGTPPTMAKHTKVDKTQIEVFQLRYFNSFPVIGSAIDPLTKTRDTTSPNYHNWVRYQLKHLGFITTLFGRRRFFYGRYNDDSTLRKAIAYAPQSMTADEIDTGILRLWRSNRVQLLIQVHDSILFQFPEDRADEIIPWALEALKAPLTLKRGREFVVPTEAKIGWNWGDFDKDKNPDGLQKWKGGNDRKRQEQPSSSAKLSLKDFL